MDCLIFDVDGVIVDTEYLDYQLQQEFIRTISPDKQRLESLDFSELVGKSYANLHQSIKHLSQTDLSLEEIAVQLERFATERYQHVDYQKLFRPDILEVISFAKKMNWKLAVASSSRKKHILEVLRACEIDHVFDLIVSGEDFAESKPNPAIYQSVLEKLAIQAADALTIEDSFYGIQAAKSAGIAVIAYEEKRMPIDQSAADWSGKDMRDILEILQKEFS